MSAASEGLVEIVSGDLRVAVAAAPPAMLGLYRRHAELVEDFPGDEADGFVFAAVGDGTHDWPGLVVTQRYSPAGPGFPPGVLLVPKRRQVFVGAGTRLLAYEARSGTWRRQWEDEAALGFWQWRRHGRVALMSAELELGAWTTDGEKLGSAPVEPPWSYRVDAGEVVLDVMGEIRTFGLTSGP
ncbi:hypothetical protein ACQP1P_25425 [Dactylosporangium sp. CA-052675]|uniref:hypothetical protein n=1 Tax=Dactylosporangium sp. CA-052675 TaxID=3239927 RepID=UPI003D8C1E85